ncbi:MAG: CDP-archaeol synthase [Anaerolineae bacterium]|nr:CDP-archaeol synthase [Anaerolineae bacterium]
MLRTRLLTAIILIPIVAWFIYRGGLPFLILIAVLTTLAEIEFCRLTAGPGFQPVHLSGIALVCLFLLDGEYPEWQVLRRGLAGILLISLSWQVLHHQRSRGQAWTGAIASGLYVGLCGSYVVRLRGLPGDGLWWTLIVVPVTLFADSVAYMVGSLWGKHKLAPLLSHGKTVEGYASGILSSAPLGALLGWLWSLGAAPGSAVTWLQGLILGVVVATVAPMGDLAISKFKREAGVKDSGKLLPGHGGLLDRMDSVLFAAVIGYAYVRWFLY